MGCVESTYCEKCKQLTSRKDGIVTISYRKRIEKIANKMQQSDNLHYNNGKSQNQSYLLNGDVNSKPDNCVTAKNNEVYEQYLTILDDKKSRKDNGLIIKNGINLNSAMDSPGVQRNVNFFPRWGLYKMCHECDGSYGHNHHNNSHGSCKHDCCNNHCFYNGNGSFVSQRRGSCGVHTTCPNNSRYHGDYCEGLGNHGYEQCGCRITNLLAMNALDLTAPASDALLKNRKNAWVQLAGHPGSFAPAGPHTIWKKRLSKENTETVVYQQLMNDIVRDLVPKFYREVEYNGEFFIEMQDLIQQFTDPNILDIKMGTRTFQESEVKNPVLRKDLYEKMVKLNIHEPTAEEHEQKAITKLRYMQFREKGSSTSTLGFRCEAIRMSGQQPITDLKKVKTKQEVEKTLSFFLQNNEEAKERIIKRLKDIRRKFESSQFFKNHEIIGSSLLFLYDKDNKAGVWLIDFAKTLLVEGKTLSHKSPWQVGNHEDGYLYGLDSLLEVLEDLDFSKVSSAASADYLNIKSSNSIEQTNQVNSSSSNEQTLKDNHEQTSGINPTTGLDVKQRTN